MANAAWDSTQSEQQGQDLLSPTDHIRDGEDGEEIAPDSFEAANAQGKEDYIAQDGKDSEEGKVAHAAQADTSHRDGKLGMWDSVKASREHDSISASVNMWIRSVGVRSNSEKASREHGSMSATVSMFLRSVGIGSRKLTDMQTDMFSCRRSEQAAACHVDLGVLRAVPARKALQSFADVMSGSGGNPTTYNLSQATEIIHSFWSHSWRANSWFKRCSLMLFYNGKAAALSSILAACVAIFLMQYGVLPGNVCKGTGCESHTDCPHESFCDVNARCLPIQFCLRYPEKSVDATCPGSDHRSSVTVTNEAPLFFHWPFVFAAVTYLFVLLFWQARSLIFLDKACIHQTDADKKRRGIDGLGGFLRCSKEMIILWDKTYFDRLWCTFELAAYTHLKRDEARIPFVPVVRGLVTFTVLVGFTLFYSAQIISHSLMPLVLMGFNTVLLCILGFAGTRIGRAYARDRQRMKEQLQNFQVSKAHCTCCALGHVDPVTKKPIECDRPVVEGVIQFWFSGGLDEFDQHVQEGLHAKVMEQMPGLLGYTELLYASLPVVWFELSKVGADCATFTLVFRRLLMMLGYWLAFNPFAPVLLLFMASFVRSRRADWRCDILVTVGIAALWAVIVVISGLIVTIVNLQAGELYGSLVHFALFLPLTVLLLRFPWTLCRSHQPATHQSVDITV